MRPVAIRELSRLRTSVKKANESYGRKLRKLSKAEQACDHRFPDGSFALKQTSTHDFPDCGGGHECAVCAGEQKETFVDVCQICKKVVR